MIWRCFISFRVKESKITAVSRIDSQRERGRKYRGVGGSLDVNILNPIVGFKLILIIVEVWI